MPLVTLTPDPVSPATTSYTLSGGGSIQTSGTGIDASGAVSGSWMVERQSLNIVYSRVPRAGLSSEALNLSSAVATHQILATHVLCQVVASYSKEHVYGYYGSSGWTQNQKFSIESASADYQGNVYGTFTGVKMGPAGEVITSQPWYQRRYWDPSLDTEVTQASSMFSFFVAQETFNGSSTNIAQAPFLNSFKNVIVPPQNAGTFLYDYDRQVYPSYDYYLQGGYFPLQETEAKVIQFIDQIGSKVTNQDLFMQSPFNSTPGAGITQYSINRHDYT